MAGAKYTRVTRRAVCTRWPALRVPPKNSFQAELTNCRRRRSLEIGLVLASNRVRIGPRLPGEVAAGGTVRKERYLKPLRGCGALPPNYPLRLRCAPPSFSTPLAHRDRVPVAPKESSANVALLAFVSRQC